MPIFMLVLQGFQITPVEVCISTRMFTLGVGLYCAKIVDRSFKI